MSLSVKFAASAVLVFCAACGGCDAMRGVRSVSMEITQPEGAWRLEGVHNATLERVGWQLRIVESKVSAASSVPRLEKIVIAIVNTSADMPLMVAQNSVTIDGIAGEKAFTGPRKPFALAQNELLELVYNPGIRAPLLLYPFNLNVTVGRPGGEKERVTIKLY